MNKITQIAVGVLVGGLAAYFLISYLVDTRTIAVRADANATAVVNFLNQQLQASQAKK